MTTRWNQWNSLEKPRGWPHLYQIAVGRNQDGRLEIFSVSTDDKLWQIWQTAPNDGWSHWERLGAPDSEGIELTRQSFGRSLDAGGYQDGRLEVCIIASGKVWCIEQTSPNNGWGPWRPLDAPKGIGDVVSLDLVRKNDGRLQLLVLSKLGRLASRRHAAPNDEWQDWDTTFPDRSVSTSVVGHENQDGILQTLVSLSGIPALVSNQAPVSAPLEYRVQLLTRFPWRATRTAGWRPP